MLPDDEEYFSYPSELQPVLSEGVCLHTSGLTGLLWGDMSDLHLAMAQTHPFLPFLPFLDPPAGVSAKEREMQGIPHTPSRTALLQACTAHGIAQGL